MKIFPNRYMMYGLILIVVLFPLLGKYWTGVATFGLIWAITAISQNIVMGYTGLLSIGQAALFGIGAYTSALLSIGGLPIWLSVMIGGLIAGVFSLLIGFPSTRSRGIYFSIITMAFTLIAVEVFINLESLTGGLQGLSGIPSLEVDYRLTYFLFIVIAFLVLFMTKNLVDSSYGDAMLAIRENERLAKSMGISTENIKLLAFIISGCIAGVAGGLYAHYVTFIAPNNFNVMISFNILIFVIVGGVGSLWGPIIGALLLSFLPEFLQIEPNFKNLIYGILLAIIIILMPKGVASLLPRIRNFRVSKYNVMKETEMEQGG
ncbi:branched-chain amino acid ABC transporter permease [Bacillus sp. FJAT-29953]|nr:branched-chain amino acid ABC transporter permease [Bacillus sp. FJAT-29953]